LTLVPFSVDRAAAPVDPDWAAELVRVAESQDRAAFGRLFQHFAPRLKSWLMRTGSSDEQAEELAQEAMVSVWRKAALFNPGQAAVSTWIFTIARNLRVDAARRRQLDGPGEESFEFDLLAAEQPGSGELLDAARLARRVRDALQQLPPEQAQVLRLSFYDDEPHARIAAGLGIPLGTVKSRMRLAVQHLRRLLDQ
jgi:RNA polymerase sigma-70 factor (ECF subfamily)